MKPEHVISRFLQEAFTDEALSKLREDAVAGRVPFIDPDRCLVGHAPRSEARFALGYGAGGASTAYCDLAYSRWYDIFLPDEGNDSLRMRRLIPLIDQEIMRRKEARAEVVRKAQEVITQSPVDTLLVLQ